MFEVLDNTSDVVIKYSQSYLKRIFIALLCIDLFLWGASILMLALHFVSNVSIFISIILMVVSSLFVIVFVVTYIDIKKFLLIIDSKSVNFICYKKNLTIPWSEVQSCGVITRTGSDELSSVFTNLHSNYYTDNKNTFYFSCISSPNLKKLVYHIRTTTLIDHGIVKDICYISEKKGAPIFRVLFDIVEKYNQNPNLKIEKMDRTDL